MKKWVLVFGLLVILAPKCFAADADIPYGVRLPYRIVRGVTNIALGWTEIILRPVGMIGTESVLEAMATGGLHTIERFSAGFTDITTFWVPDIQMEELYPDWQVWPYLFHWS